MNPNTIIPESAYKIDLKIVTLGNVDAGKSSLLGVLSSNNTTDKTTDNTYDDDRVWDDGRGLAREKMFKHSHELQSGRTSSISQRTVIIEDINDSSISNKIILYDMAGHEKYLKTTLRGLSGIEPDYAMILIEGLRGIQRMTKEHIIASIYLNVPMFFVITKIDITPPDILNRTKMILKKTMERMDYKLFFIEKYTDIENSVKIINCNFIPVLMISSKDGNKINPPFHYLTDFMARLTLRKKYYNDVDKPLVFTIDNKFKVAGYPVILSGNVKQGSIKLNDELFLGPFQDNFIAVTVKSIHNNDREMVNELYSGQAGCLAVKGILDKERLQKADIRTGMFIVDRCITGHTTFIASIHILPNHCTSIRVNSTMIIHCGNIRQSIRVIHIWKSEIDRKNRTDLNDTGREQNIKNEKNVKNTKNVKNDKNNTSNTNNTSNISNTSNTSNTNDTSNINDTNETVLRGGDNGLLEFQFAYKPEYIVIGDRFLFCEGRTRGYGIITEIKK
jgi:elongation factor 1-alpha